MRAVMADLVSDQQHVDAALRGEYELLGPVGAGARRGQLASGADHAA